MNHLPVYDPLARAAFDQIVRGFLQPARVEKTGRAIRLDVSETDVAYFVRAEVPGVQKDDIQVTIDGGEVTIGAEVKPASVDGERVLRSERHAGAVYRSFAFASEIDEAASEAKYENGVLELKLAKKTPLAARKLTIQ
ncbi:MAG: Hsp20/alpha crystallin family protein [Betaproteobacteria bacterium]